MRRENSEYRTASAVSLLTFIVYLAALKNDFVYWDDNDYVFENPFIRSMNKHFFRVAFFDFYDSNWHPLTWISHALDYALWGLNPVGHHLTSIALHAVNAGIVVLLITKLIEIATASTADRESGYFNKRSVLIAGATTGILFGLHPLHVESVAWVSERKDLLCALFFLLSIMAYTKYAANATAGAKGTGHRVKNIFELAHGSLPCALCLFALALLSKPMAVTLPLVLLILDWYPFKRIASRRTFLTVFAEKLPFFALSLASSVITLLAQDSGKALREDIPWLVREPVATKSLIAYLWKMALPLDLIPFYPYPRDLSLLSVQYLAPIVLVPGITAACVVAAKKQKLWLSVWGYYVITLIPVLGIVQVGGQAMADRYTYLPSLGPFLVAGLVVAHLSSRVTASAPRLSIARTLSGITAFFLFASMTYLTFVQIGIWKNSISLWSYVIEKEPEKVPQAYNNRGNVLAAERQPVRALEDYDKAISLLPSYYEAHYGRGLVFEQMGRFDTAMQDFNEAISLKPSRPEAYYGRAVAFHDMGMLDQAWSDYDKVVHLNPSSYEAHYGRGLVSQQQGRFDRALGDYNEAIALNPGRYEAYHNRGLVLGEMGLLDKALESFNTAALLVLDNPLVFLNRGNLYVRTGNISLAVTDYKKACDLGSLDGCEKWRELRSN